MHRWQGGGAMTIKCPYCGAVYDIEENECGCRARCEACGKRFVIGHVATSGRNHLGVSKRRTSDGLWHNNSSKSRWKGAWHSLWICSIIGLVVFTWVSSESEKGRVVFVSRARNKERISCCVRHYLLGIMRAVLKNDS